MCNEIQERRIRIDEIDDQLLSLLNKRMQLVVEVGVIKKRLGLPISDIVREENVLLRVSGQNRGLLDEEGALKIFKLIISESCRIEARASGMDL